MLHEGIEEMTRLASWTSAYTLLADTMRAAAEEEAAKEALTEALLV